MYLSIVAQQFVDALFDCSDRSAFTEMLFSICDFLGFQYFALSQHPNTVTGADSGFRIHSYPRGWEREYDQQGLGRSDPIHRASHISACGFRWRDVPRLIRFTGEDAKVLEQAQLFGIGEGYTIPANVPGEVRGSVTFATGAGQEFPDDRIVFAQAIGSYAFQAARTLEHRRPVEDSLGLTPRQLDCVLWVGGGKSNWEIAQILGIQAETVKKHLRDACERYQLVKRSALPLRALFVGALCFSDIFP